MGMSLLLLRKKNSFTSIVHFWIMLSSAIMELKKRNGVILDCKVGFLQ